MQLADLLKDPPRLHRRDGKLTSAWKLADEELQFLWDAVQPGMRTLETGAGISTLVFAIRGARHTVVVPDQELVDRIEGWLRENGVATSGLELIVAGSESALPAISQRCEEYDLALIDGSHAFPMPFVDWLYVAGMLKVGGTVIVDDMHIWTCEVLSEFLAADPAWEMTRETVWATAFRKLDTQYLRHSHKRQPFVVRHSRESSAIAKLRYLSALVSRRNLPLIGTALRQKVDSAFRGRVAEDRARAAPGSVPPAR